MNKRLVLIHNNQFTYNNAIAIDNALFFFHIIIYKPLCVIAYSILEVDLHYEYDKYKIIALELMHWKYVVIFKLLRIFHWLLLGSKRHTVDFTWFIASAIMWMEEIFLFSFYYKHLYCIDQCTRYICLLYLL